MFIQTGQDQILENECRKTLKPIISMQAEGEGEEGEGGGKSYLN